MAAVLVELTSWAESWMQLARKQWGRRHRGQHEVLREGRGGRSPAQIWGGDLNPKGRVGVKLRGDGEAASGRGKSERLDDRVRWEGREHHSTRRREDGENRGRSGEQGADTGRSLISPSFWTGRFRPLSPA